MGTFSGDSPSSDEVKRAVEFGFKPLEPYPGPRELWRCVRIECGHEVQTKFVYIRRGKAGCPVCSGKRIVPGFNDFASKFPEVAAQADGWDPTSVGVGSHRKFQWRCSEGHVWLASPGNRTKGRGCPYCSNRKLLKGFNDLATLRPEIAAEADGWDPSTLILGAAAKKRWKCLFGHTWEATLNKRVSAGRGCPYCAGQKVWVGFNDFASRNPQLVAEADGWDPTTVTSRSGVKQNWKCSLGHTWQATPWERTGGSGCPYCLSQAVWPGFNDFASKRPDRVSWVDGWDPTIVATKSEKTLSWKCPKGHSFQMRVKHVTLGAQCPVCLNDQIIPGINDLKTSHPELASEAHGWDPTTLSYGSTKKRTWMCSLGHSWEASVSSRTNMESGCPVCSGRQVLKGFNDLATLNPELAREAVGWDPSTVTVSTSSKRKWRCNEGHEWTTAVATRSQGRGCPTCAKSGFDPNKDGYLYFLEHDGWTMLQIGITNNPGDRLARHERLGWNVVEVRGLMEGHLANDLETAMLRSIKKRGGVFANQAGVARFDGWSEAWLTTSLEVAGLKDLLNLVYDDETPVRGD